MGAVRLIKMLTESNLRGDHVQARLPAPPGSGKSNQAGASDAAREAFDSYDLSARTSEMGVALFVQKQLPRPL